MGRTSRAIRGFIVQNPVQVGICYHRLSMVTTKDLLRSHAELRGALILAGKRIRKLNFGRKDADPVLPILRRVLAESRAVARQAKTDSK